MDGVAAVTPPSVQAWAQGSVCQGSDFPGGGVPQGTGSLKGVGSGKRLELLLV